MSKWTVGRLKEILSKYPNDTPVCILFECTEAHPYAVGGGEEVKDIMGHLHLLGVPNLY